MEYRQLGHTDIKVSVICLGTMTFGEQNIEAEAHEQLDYALEQGVNFIDTAEMYAVPPRPETQGLTEQYIGTWLKKRSDREQIILASKVAGPSERLSYLRGGTKLNAAHINEAVDDSLKRLQTDYLDLYQVHWPSRNTNFFGKLGYEHGDDPHAETIAETLEALDQLVQSGKVRTIGLSNETPWGLHEYLRLSEREDKARVVSVQNPYNLLNRSYEVGLAEFAQRSQVGLLAYSPLGFGVLSGKYLDGQRPAGARITRWEEMFPRYISEPAQQATLQYVSLAREHNLDPAQMALAFVNSRPFVTSNIIGATTMEQLQANIASADLELPDSVLEGIEAIHEENTNPCP